MMLKIIFVSGKFCFMIMYSNDVKNSLLFFFIVKVLIVVKIEVELRTFYLWRETTCKVYFFM